MTTTTLYSLARKDKDGSRYFDLASAVDERAFIARLVQDGVERKAAARIALAAARTSIRGDAQLETGDMFMYDGIGPNGSTYRVQATTVRIASLA
jgi:hypothetical protein